MTWKVATAKKGQRSPPPLPMYERVVLKHVPTMVRRRYDRDLNIIDENQGKGEDDEAEDLDDSFDDYEEAEDDTHASLDAENDSQFCKGNFGGNNIESSSSSCSKDCEDGHDGGKDEDLVRYVEASMGETEAHENEQGSCSKDVEVVEDDRALDMNLASHDVDARVKNEAEHDEQGLHVVEDCESTEVVGAKDVNDVASYNVDESTVKYQEVLEKGGHLKEHEKLDNKQGKGEDDEAEDLDDSFDDYEEEEDDTHASLDTENDSQFCKGNFGGNNIESSSSSCSKGCEDGHDGGNDEDLVRYVEASMGKNEAHENEQDCKSKDEGAEDANISVQGDIQDMEDQTFDDKQVQEYLDSKERKEEDDRANDVDVSNYMDASVKNDVQDIEQEDDKSEGDGIEDNQSLDSDYKDGSVQVQGNIHLVNFDNQKGSCIEIFESEGDGFKDVNNGASDYVDAKLSNAQDKEQGSSDENNNEKITLSFGKDSPAPLPMYERVLLKHVPTIVRRRYDKVINKFDTYPDLSEDVKSEGDGGEDFLPSTTSSDVDGDSGDDEACRKPTLNTKHDTQTYANEDFQLNSKFGSSTNIQSEEIKSEDGEENDQGSHSKDVEEEDDKTKDVNLASDADTNIKTESEHCEQGLLMEDCETKVGGTKYNDDNAFAADIDEIDTSVENEVKHNEHGNEGSKQGSCSKDVEVVEDDRAVDMNLASHDVDASVKNEAEHDEQGLHVVEDGKSSEGGGAKDGNDVASYNVDESTVKYQEVLEKGGHLKEHENLENKQDLIPEVFVKTLEQEGYELCCPNCKHYITHTMIFRRRNDDQQFKTTCLTFLISLFCCN